MTPDEQRLLAELSTHPAWVVLNKVSEERQAAEFRRLATEIFAGTKVDQIDIDFRRGFFAGMGFLLDKPAAEERALLKALKREEVKASA